MSKQARYSRRRQSEEADVGPIPPPVHPVRRELCRCDLLLFLQTYFPYSTGINPFSADHVRAIERMEHAILFGGYFLFVVFRGFGKSTICENATLWGTLYGHLKFPVPIAADATAAAVILDSVRAEIETNDLLCDDFPEVCLPVRALEGKTQRCHSQTQGGRQTHITWKATEIVYPTIIDERTGKPYPSSGAVIKPRGITANIRGMRHKTPSGAQLRPDFVILDDPQTDISARSPEQVSQRLSLLNKAILRLGGHSKKLAAVCTATIIEHDDMIHRLANPSQYPAWQSERVPMLKSFAAEHETFWLGEYAGIRNAYNPDVPGDQARAHREATEFYGQHRERADRGARATWIYCYDDSELSAIQHAYNILIDTGFAAFMAECQNEPHAESTDLDQVSAHEINQKQNGYARGIVPGKCSLLTAFIDVQGKLLYWVVCAWQSDFTGYVLDYGSWPDQQRSRWTLADATKTLRRRYRGTDDEGAIFAGLTELVEFICGREWPREDGTTMRLGRVMVDANWGKTSQLVTSCLRQSKYAPMLVPSYGRGIKATHKPISQWAEAKASGSGPEWVTAQIKGRAFIGLMYDTNYWKQRLHGALGLPLGSKGCLSLFKSPRTGHRMLADHLDSERAKRVEHDGRTVFEFALLPGRENHFLDCVVGNMVCASTAGISNLKEQPRRPVRRKARFREL